MHIRENIIIKEIIINDFDNIKFKKLQNYESYLQKVLLW